MLSDYSSPLRSKPPRIRPSSGAKLPLNSTHPPPLRPSSELQIVPVRRSKRPRPQRLPLTSKSSMDEPSTDSTDLLHPPTFILPPKFLTNTADVEPNPDETCPATATFLQMLHDMVRKWCLILLGRRPIKLHKDSNTARYARVGRLVRRV